MRFPITTAVDTRRVQVLLSAGILALASFSSSADARSCRTMKPPAFMAMPMHPMYHPKQQGTYPGGKYMAWGKAGPSVIDVTRRAGDFTNLLAAVEKAGLAGLLEGEGPYTLFAPTDAAFKSLPEGALQELLEDESKLAALLKYHLVPGRITAADILVKQTLKAASGQELPTGDLGVVRADIRARNGIVHIVDKVLLPSG